MFDWQDLTPLYPFEPMYLYIGYTGYYVCATWRLYEGVGRAVGTVIDYEFPGILGVDGFTLLAKVMPWRVNISHGVSEDPE
jgi:hypothetical protein